MNRALRSHRGKKEEFLKKGAIILCKIESENKLFQILEDWKINDEKIFVSELIEQESKRKNKLQFQCQGKQELDISIKWTEVEGSLINESDNTQIIIEEEIINQAIRSLINEEKQKVEKTQVRYDFEESQEISPKKIKKVGAKKEDASAKISEVSDSSDSDSSEEAEAEPVPKKQRQSRKTEEKAAKKGKKRGKKRNDQFKNLRSISSQYDGQEDYFIDYQSTRMNNKEIIRAALTGNQKLMENIFETKYKISNIDDEWGPEYDITALEILLIRQDKELLKYYLQNKHKVIKTRDLPCQLKEINTGYNKKQAYGVKLRKVALGRGNREGNNAFVYDLNNSPDLEEIIIRLLQIETDPELFELFFLYCKNENYEHYLIDLVCFAVRCGNIKVAKYLINYASKTNQEGYGFNYLHHDALGDDNNYNFEQIKKISITKKTQTDRLITPIHCACINPSEKFLKYFMEQTMEYNIQDENGQKPVHYAAVSQTSNCLQYLLENRVDAREGDKFLTTPLMLAAQYGRAHNVKLLCDTNLKAKNKEGNSAIHLASKNGHKECVKILLQNGVLINFAGKNRMTPLHYAAAYNFLELVEFLLDEGARINAKDKFGRTPLVMAVRNGNLAIMSKLLYYGADMKITDSSKNTVVHYAAAYGFLDCLETLIEAGADQNELNSWKLSPLNVALAKNHLKIVKTLLSYDNTDVNCIDDDGSTLVATLIQQFDQTQEKFDFIKYLIEEKKADIHIPDKYGKTCLQIAMSNSQSEFQIQLIELLLKCGANVNALDKNGRSCLFIALNGPQTDIQKKLVKLLLNHGANMNSQEKENGISGFSLCLQKKNYSLILDLIADGFEPDVNVVNDRKETLIHILINNQFYYTDDGMKLFDIILNKIDKSLLNHHDSSGYVPILKLADSFMQSVTTQIANNYRQRVDKVKQTIWNKIQADYISLKEELQNNTNKVKEQQLSMFNQTQQTNQQQQPFGNSLFQNQNSTFGQFGGQNQNSIFQSSNLQPQGSNLFSQNSGFVTNLNNLQPQTQQQSYNQLTNLNQQKKKIQESDLVEFQYQYQADLTFDSYQKHIQQLIQNQGFIDEQTSYQIDQQRIKIGITHDHQKYFLKQQKKDGILYQDRIIKYIEQLIQKGAKPHRAYIRSSLSLRKQFSSKGCKNIFHLIFSSFFSVSFLKQTLKIFPNKFLNEQDSFGTPLHYFINQYQTNNIILFRKKETTNLFLEYLITLNLNFTERNRSGSSPAFLIAYRYQDSLIGLLNKLLNLGGTINDYNNENVVPLHYYVSKGNLKMVKLFISSFGADPNFQDKYGRTSLHYAINYSNPNANASFQMEQCLIKAGAKCDIRDIYQRTPLFYAFIKFQDPRSTQEIDPFESVSSLLAHNDCEVKIVDKYDRSPLHYAALRGSAISGRYMIKMGAQVDIPDSFNNTPLAYAFFTHSNFSTMLIDNKADVNRMINIISEFDYIDEKRKYYSEIVNNDPAIKLRCEKELSQLESQVQNQQNFKLIQDIQEESMYSDDQEQNVNQKLAQKIEIETNDFNKQNKIEEEQNNEKRQQEILQLEQQKEILKQQIIGTEINNRLNSDIDVPQLLFNKMQTGQYSYFSQAIKFGWQGVAYLLISDGYEFIKAIQDAINANQFQLVLTLLMKVKSKDLSRVNEKGQNLFHLFAKFSKSVAYDLKQEIVAEFEQKNISPYVQDQYLKLPLHYAVENYDQYLTDYFIYQRNCDVNLMDDTQNNVFTIILQRDYSTSFQRMITIGLKMDVQFRILFSQTLIKPFLYLIEHKQVYNTKILQQFVDQGVDINEQNSKKQTALTIAIKNNNYDLMQFLIKQPTFKPEFHAVDDEGKTPIHHVVLPLEFGSYENLQMLKDLLPLFDYNLKDNDGQTPLDYALIFDAQIMKNELLKLNAHHTRSLRQQRMPTSIIATAQWPDEKIDFEDDAQQFSDNILKGLEADKDNKIIVDNQARNVKNNLVVYEDSELGLFQCLLSKVDIVNKGFHRNVFYKMQILFDSTRKNYILFTKWGQIGEEGQFQMTPFEDLESTVKEYCKIFAAKTGGNSWKLIRSGEVEFEKKPEKYQLMQFKTNLNYKSILEPFDLSEKSPYPKCHLDSSIQNVVEQISQVKLFQQELRQYQFDTGFVPLEKLDKSLILKAKEYLLELRILVREVNVYSQQSEIELKKLQNYYQEINDKSARYYEIIPQGEMRQNMLPMLETEDAINRQLQLIELLLNVELSVKILLGAHNRLDKIHPLTYCFNALNIKMLTLGKQDLEYKMIKTYVNRTQQVKINNIFAIERKGEAQRFEQYKDSPRVLLWHGSKISNFVSLLAMGLKIAPSWAYITGALYGKGIYFADQFSKSFAYTNDYTVNNSYGFSSYQNRQKDKSLNLQKYKYILLCEVSCQNQYDLYNYEGQIMENIYEKPEITLKVVGSQGPDQNSQIRMPNGCVVPIGNIVKQTIPENLSFPALKTRFQTNQTEYIIYDESRVRLRYLVQVES